MDFTDFLQKQAQMINLELNLIFKDWRNLAKNISPKLIPIVNASIDASNGGKRLRGALVILSYQMVSPNRKGDILKISAACEIFQTSILAHDDIIDLSPLRRGQPTLYKLLGGGHYGISQAISSGDVGFFIGYQLIANSKFPDKYKTAAIQSFSQTSLETALGEILDVAASKYKDRDEKEALTIFKLKTARYTIVGPMLLGAILGGANNQLLDTISKFGNYLGIAYQIQDDILGVFGDEKSVGKSVTSDIEEGKNTLLITYTLDNANKTNRNVLKKLYGKGKISKVKHEMIKKIFVESGALDYSNKTAIKYINSAKKLIPKLTKDKKYRLLLNDLADYLVKRDR